MSKRGSSAFRAGGPATAVALAAWGLALAAGILFDLHVPSAAEPRGLTGVATTLAAVAATEILRLIAFVPLGFLSVLAVGGEGHRRRSLGALLGVVLGTAITAANLLVAGHRAGWVDLTAPAAACLVGSWLGAGWLRGQRAWLVGKLALVALGLSVLVVGGGALLTSRVLEETPVVSAASGISQAERLRLLAIFRGKSPQSLDAGAIQSIELEEQDLRSLAAWSLSAAKPAPVVDFDLGVGRGTLRASVKLPRPVLGRSYANLIVGAEVAVRDGHLDVQLDRLKLGGVEASAGLLSSLSRLTTACARRDERLATVLPAIRELVLTDTAMAITYGHLELPQGFASQLFIGQADRQALLPAVRAQAKNLLDLAPAMPRGDDQFAACLRSAFALARDRSVEGDPPAENQAALLALGILLGRPDIESFVGEVLDEAVQGRQRRDATGGASHPLFATASIRGRHDWAQHWAVAAALAVLGSKGIALGIMPEDLDATGVDAFGFADLLGDRAGARFAGVATRDAAAARRMQERLAAGFDVDDFYPPATGLWSGSGEEFRRIYGTYDSPAFRRDADEIERRLDGCAGLR